MRPTGPSAGNAFSIASVSESTAALLICLNSEDLFEFDLVLEMQMQVGEQVAEQRVGRQAVGQRVGNPRRRHRAGLAQALTHGFREPGPPFGGQMQQHLFV